MNPEIERLREDNRDLIQQVNSLENLVGEVERLRDELKASREIGVSDQRTIQNLVMERDTLRAQLAEARLLLREIRHDCSASRLRDGKIDQFLHKTLSASAEPKVKP